jgi:hypothetical protein
MVLDAKGKWFYRHGATVIPIVYVQAIGEQEFVDRINGFTSMKHTLPP